MSHTVVVYHSGYGHTKLMAEESGESLLDAGDEVRWVASFAPRSRVRRGDTIEIVIDTERVHWFDPQTSAAIRD